MYPVRRMLILGLILSGLAPMEGLAWTDYLRDVKPLLKEKCYSCHGALRAQADLRLDTAASLVEGGASGTAITRGRADDSLLVGVLTGEAGFRMPPANEGTPFTDDEIQRIRDWINAGAPLPDNEDPQVDPQSWWSYRPIDRPALPSISRDWSRNEIDLFIEAARRQRGLPYAGEADKALWLRRVFLDLIGLPPTREERLRFLADDSPRAFEKVVDDLLARPQYGERWARHWMDIWRYSDWYGSRGINEIRYSQRHIWRWRDWIVQSLNDDKGYDQMIREMLAADEIAGDDPTVLAATGYLGRNWYKFDRDAWLFETVERTGEAFLGMTLRCCRCHDHKFDPVTQEEYYRFRAFFEPHDVRTDPVSALQETERDASQGDVLTDGLARVYDKTADAPTYRFERGDSRYPDQSQPLVPGIPSALGGSIDVRAVKLPVGAWYPMLRTGVRETLIAQAIAEVAAAESDLIAAGAAVRTATEKLDASLAQPVDDKPVVWLDEDFASPNADEWESLNGNWEYADGTLRQTSVTSFATMVTKRPLVGDFHIQLRYRTLHPGSYRSVGFSFDFLDKGNSQDVYTSTGDRRQSVQAFHRQGGKQVYPREGIVYTSLEVDAETLLEASVVGASLTIDLNGERKLDYELPTERRDGRFAIWVHQGAAEFLSLRITGHADSPATLTRRKQEAERTEAIARATLALTKAKADSIAARLAAEMARYRIDSKPHAVDVDELAREASSLERRVEVLAAEVAVARAVTDSRQLAEAREKLRTAQEAATTSAHDYAPFGATFPETSTGRRSALASWIAARENPRTARVAVNHLWARHFGRPLVATPENFGLNGRPPTHPRLLDWLARELMDNNWRMKPLHKKIVLSATYRMSSRAEGIGGTAVEPSRTDPENQFFWRMPTRRMEAELVRDATLALSRRLDLQLGGPELSESDGETILRRSIYFRNTPNEKMGLLEVFDMANPNACYRRKESVVPHQSLALMNSGLTQDAARRIAAQLTAEEDFVTAAFEAILGRLPAVEEWERSATFLDQHATLLEKGLEDVFSGAGSAQRDPASAPAQRARENFVHVLLLHNDFVTIR